MKTVVICNVGTRDVVAAVPDGERPPRARAHGARLLAQLDAGGDAAALRFPILKPALDAILGEVDVTQIDRLLLVGTDQDPQTTPERHRANDTLFFARLVQRVLVPQYGARIRDARVIEVGSEETPVNPALYDQAYDRLGGIVAGLAAPGVTCHVVPVGGIPALNTALILQGVRLFGARCRVRFVTEAGQPYALQAGVQLMGMMREHTAIDRLRRLDFAAALPLLATGRDARDPVAPLIRYASARLWFDFDQAQRYLNDAVHLSRALPGAAAQLEAEQHALQLLRGGDPLALLGELYFNAAIAWENGRFVDFVGRATRFHEALLLHLAEADAPHLLKDISPEAVIADPEARQRLQAAVVELGRTPRNAVADNRSQLRQLRQRMAQVFDLEDLRTLCFDLGVPFDDLSGTRLPNKIGSLLDYALRHEKLETLMALLQQERSGERWHLAWETPEVGLLPLLHPVLTRLARLWLLRQASIIGHGFGGVSRQTVLQAYNSPPGAEPESPVQDMYEAVQRLGIPPGNPLLRVRDLLLRLLGQAGGADA